MLIILQPVMLRMTEPHRHDGDTRIQSVDVSFDIVARLIEEGPETITELAEALERSPSNVLAHLRTLENRGFVVERDGRYRPGLRYYEIGNRVKQNYPLYRHGTGPADKLADETGEYVWLMVEEQGKGYYLYKSGGESAVESGAYTMGSRWHLYSTASGKVVLAHMDEERLHQVLDAYGFKQRTPNTITDRDILLSELEQIREDGFAIDEEESAVGIRGVAVPVRGLDGLIGTVAISGPASRIKGEYFRSTLPEKVQETADIIRIRYNGASAVDN